MTEGGEEIDWNLGLPAELDGDWAEVCCQLESAGMLNVCGQTASPCLAVHRHEDSAQA